MHVNTVHMAALAKMTKPAVVHPGKILPGKLLFSLSIQINFSEDNNNNDTIHLKWLGILSW